MATYTIFAGVNGAGKTSIYQSTYYEQNKNEKRINTDEMVARIGSWKDSNLQMKCAREAVKLIKTYISEEVSFNQETTLSGRSIINNIKKAKQNGYTIIVNYIGVESAEIAKQRVDLRVKKGGHGIEHKDIERRYVDSLENLVNIIPICDEINVYDNTDIFKLIACIRNGQLIWNDEELPEWIKQIVK
ncbi:putative ABC-type ATPase [Clostridium tetanomorphum]|uniref:UDP-N-acetylglucosamine kinase n=1 Tax=Clostridium tetanomorphum TaxID=1553 RepID=A0A923E4L7_CLOTT|nr:zeta toxin family protein [Clostridium tetanomorphum]KAJ50216.1 hypothetical protein CTM_19219 [Clostridium tetanomorphum DSM 665]MBC2396223.1 ATPase [Clostridium tetanomorphum]MBP1864355.1 putative ABC-type ATPase [Clostridium tetanomorphum]NRS83801.1 putative ABC-type ATPase [Clostridium tetanomorphum]NRZ96992.1 putative ABC-type ATPase [Clostridium tetanomorphum]